MSEGLPLTPKQRRFLQEYQVDWNATQAALRAGYSEKTIRGRKGAYHITKSSRMRAAIAGIQKANVEQTGLKVQDVLEGLYAEALGLRRDTTAAARVRAWTVLGRHLGMFVNRHDHTGDVSKSLTVEFVGCEDPAESVNNSIREQGDEEPRGR